MIKELAILSTEKLRKINYLNQNVIVKLLFQNNVMPHATKLTNKTTLKLSITKTFPLRPTPNQSSSK